VSFPRVQGLYQMTRAWSVTLPDEFARRFEESEFSTDLVLWRPGITCWSTAYNYREGDTPQSSYDLWRLDCPAEAVEVFDFKDTSPLRFGFLLYEQEPGKSARWALHTYTFGEQGWMLMAIYYDDPATLGLAKQIWFSLIETTDLK